MRLLRGLAGRVLPCGCLVGVYETYSGLVVATIDARGSDCSRASHRVNGPVDVTLELAGARLAAADPDDDRT